MTNYDDLAQAMTMEEFGTKRISGGALRKMRFNLALTQTELAAKIGLSAVRVRQIEKSIDAGIQPKIWRKLMELTGKTLEEVEAILAIPGADDDEALDANVEPYSEQAVEEIPTIELPVAAGRMVEMPEVEELNDPRLQRARTFRIRIRGDSMEKKFPDGSLIEFHCLMPTIGELEGSKLEIGKHYYVQASERATFKTLESFDNEQLTFVAINKRKYPEKIVLSRQEISRMAKAMAIINLVG